MLNLRKDKRYSKCKIFKKIKDIPNADMIFVKTFTLADFAKFKNLPKESA